MKIAERPFEITGDLETLQALQDEYRRQHALELGKRILVAPLQAVGRGIVSAYQELEVDIYDRLNGTDFRTQINQERTKAKHQRMAEKIVRRGQI
jgi:hypothetical protein